MPKPVIPSTRNTSSEVNALRQQVEALTEENAYLKLLVAKYRRMHFGQKAESQAQLGQLDLALAYDPLAIKLAESVKPSPAANDAAVEKRSRKRKPFPETLPRETVTHMPPATDCPDCGGQFKLLGEDVSEMLEYVPASFRVIRHVRPKLACAHCDHIAQADAPARPIPRGIAGPALLAHTLVGKFCDHLPLYRQSAIYARSGLDLDRALLAEWVGHCHALLSPLVETIQRYVLGGSKVHADDTPLPVLSPGKGRTKTARLWTYVRDDRPAGNDDPPAVWFAYSEDRKGHHPRDHLKSFKGVLQADAYAGFNALYETGDIQEAACWAHYLESVFIWSGWPTTHVSRSGRLSVAERSAEQTPHNSGRYPDGKQRVGGWRCRYRCGRSRLPRHTSPPTSGAMPVCPHAPCIRPAAVHLPAMEVMRA